MYINSESELLIAVDLNPEVPIMSVFCSKNKKQKVLIDKIFADSSNFIVNYMKPKYTKGLKFTV